MSHIRVLALTVLVALPSVAVCQDTPDLKYLVRLAESGALYDYQKYTGNKYVIENLRSLLQASEASTSKQLKGEAARLGVKIDGLLDLRFGGHRAIDNFAAWKKAFLSMSIAELESYEGFTIEIKTISPEMTAMITSLVSKPNEGTFFVVVVPSPDDLTFALKLIYSPRNNESCRIESIKCLSTPSGMGSLVDEDQLALVKKGTVVPKTGITVLFRRENINQTVTFAINTSEGTRVVNIAPARDPNEVIERLTRRLDELEKRIPILNAGPDNGYVQIGDLAICWGRASLGPDPQPHTRSFDFRFPIEFDGKPTVTTGVEVSLPNPNDVFSVYHIDLRSTGIAGQVWNNKSDKHATYLKDLRIAMSYMAIGKLKQSK